MPAWTHSPDIIGAIVGFLLTLMVFSYIIGDNFLFRLAIHIFIGMAAAFAAVLTVYNVILPVVNNTHGGILRFLPLLIIVLALLLKFSPLARLGNPAMAYLVGVGAAVAIGGAVLGTIFPQTEASMAAFPKAGSWKAMVDAGILVVGTLATLVYFQFSTPSQTGGTNKRPRFFELFATVGQLFIMITLGVIFAGVLIAALGAFIERIHALWVFLWDTLPTLVPK